MTDIHNIVQENRNLTEDLFFSFKKLPSLLKWLDLFVLS